MAKFNITLINGQEVVEEADDFKTVMGVLVFGRKAALVGGEPRIKIYGPAGYISVEQLPSYEDGLIEAMVIPDAN